MGRSVSYLSHAKHVVYFEWPKLYSYDEETGEEVETDEYEDFHWVLDDIKEMLQGAEETLEPTRRWEGNEDRIFLENDYCEIGLSEYCGLASISIRVNDRALENTDTQEEYNIGYAKSEKWIEESWPKLQDAIPFKLLKRVGGFSNGESVYEYVKKENEV